VSRRRGAAALGIDVGTTAVKAVVVQADGTVAGQGRRAVAIDRDGAHATQDPEALWDAVIGAARDALAAADGGADPATALGAIGVCSQYSSIVPVDRDGRPVAELVTYLDHRGTDHCLAILARHPEAFVTWIERHGIPPIGDGLSLAHLLHFQHDRPEVHARTAWYLEPMDYVNLRLTGRPTATQCSMFAAQVCDNRRWGTAYDDELVDVAGLDPDRLPPLVPVDGWAGTLSTEAAAALGVPPGIPVAAGMNDSHAGAYATGVFGGTHLGVVIGTTAVLHAVLDELRTDLEHSILSVPGPEPGRYLLWAENGLAGKAVEHVLTAWCCTDDLLGDHRVPDPFHRLDALLAAARPQRGALFLPFLAGSLSPRAAPGMRGAFLNLSLDTTRTDLVRAAVEGTVLNLAWLLGAVERFLGRDGDEQAQHAPLVLGGGAARSVQWARLVADVLGRPVRRLVHPEVAVARAVALVALGRAETAGGDRVASPPVEEAVLVRTEDPIQPDPAHRARWDARRVAFTQAFEALVGVYDTLGAAEA